MEPLGMHRWDSDFPSGALQQGAGSELTGAAMVCL